MPGGTGMEWNGMEMEMEMEMFHHPRLLPCAPSLPLIGGRREKQNVKRLCIQ